jgi:Peptidase S24-like
VLGGSDATGGPQRSRTAGRPSLGDSMINANIQDGDSVLIRPQQTARDGDIVVAQVEENAVTLKQFFKEQGRIRLQPANPDYPAMFYNDDRRISTIVRWRLVRPRGTWADSYTMCVHNSTAGQRFRG